MKHCCRCKKEKHEREFNYKNKLKKILHSACRHCTRKQTKKHYHANREYYLNKSRKRNTKIREENRKFIYEYLSSNPCKDCGENDPVVLEFDHINNKETNISTLIRKNHSLNKIKNEIKKCEVRCANCHRRKTAKDFNWYKQAPVA